MEYSIKTKLNGQNNYCIEDYFSLLFNDQSVPDLLQKQQDKKLRLSDSDLNYTLSLWQAMLLMMEKIC